MDDVVAALNEDGYALVPQVLGAEQVAAAAAELARIFESTPLGRNDFEGTRSRRIYALFAKTRAFDEVALLPLVDGVVQRVLGPAQFSAPVGIEIAAGETAQGLHTDESVYPLPWPHAPAVLNTMWPIDAFTIENGATRLIPSSHRWERDRRPTEAECVQAVMEPGDVLFYLGSLWHGGSENRTSKARVGVILEYAAAWLRPQENHVLAVPAEVVGTLPPRLQELLGYNIYPPFLGYVDGRHPKRLLDR